MLDVYKFSQYMTAYHHKSRRFKLKYNGLRDCVNIDFKILFSLIYLFIAYLGPLKAI